MFISKTLSVSLLALLGSGAVLACSSDDKKASSGPQSGNDGGGGSGGGGGGDAGACDLTLSPGADDLTTIQSALDTQVKSGNTVCFSPGTYKLKNHIALSAAANVTFRGTGAKRDDVLFDFTGQTAGEEGMLVTTDHFTVENLSIKNTAGNGIKVQADDVVFRNIKVGWDKSVSTDPDAGPASGAYAIYPVNAKNVLMEDNEAYGAADAGIYTGQCQHVIARRNKSHDNVLGIEIENSIDAEVYENDVYDNTDGFLLDLLPKLQQKTAKNYLVHDNHVHDNNLPNFAKKNTLAAVMPQGTGILVLAASDVEVTKNNIENNDGVGVIIVSYDIVDTLTVVNGGTPEPPDTTTPRRPTNVYVHGNTYNHNGTNPQASYALLAPKSDAGVATIPYDVLWDGVRDGTDDAAAKICLGDPEKDSFVNFKGGDVTTLLDPKTWTTDSTAHQCTLPAIPPLTP